MRFAWEPGRPTGKITAQPQLNTLLWFGLIVFPISGIALGQDEKIPAIPLLGEALTDAQVVRFARLALDGLDTEYPNKPSNVMVDAQSVRAPRELYPAFYGCFDWHSSVHGHWMLVRILRIYPECSAAAEIREKLANHLEAENLLREANYFSAPHNRNFERMYGWAWLLRLVTELDGWDDEQGRQWRASLIPLEKILVEKTIAYLPNLTYPIRTGVHPDSGFALAQILDYSRHVRNSELEKLVIDRSRDYYFADFGFPDRYEPSGEDFFSSGLNEADLMRRLLNGQEFSDWLGRFLPKLESGESRLFSPVEVSDVTDGKIVHLAGLNLSRGWCFRGLASALPDGDPRQSRLLKAAADHSRAGYKYVFSGHYEGEHWLATFAIYLHTECGINKLK